MSKTNFVDTNIINEEELVKFYERLSYRERMIIANRSVSSLNRINSLINKLAIKDISLKAKNKKLDKYKKLLDLYRNEADIMFKQYQ